MGLKSRIWIAFLATAGLTNSVEAAGPSVESVAPGVGQRGAEFSVKLIGAGLAEASELLLYSPGIECIELKASSDNELTAMLKATAECRLGSHPFRVRTARGISELRILRITGLPVVTEIEPNESIKQPMSITNNVTVTGSLEKGDFDCFEVEFKKGERIAAEVEAVRLGANLVDTVVEVFGPDGKLLASADDTSLFGQDPFVTLIAPVDGKYVVRVHEVNLEGDENSRYALHVGHFPRPSRVFPAGGPAGKRIDIRFEGDAAGMWTAHVSLPASPQNDFGIFAEHRGMTSPTPIPFRVSAFDNAFDVGPNDNPSQITREPVSLPIAFNGILERPSDVDCFRFQLEAGKTIQFNAFANRIGSPADTVISILELDGTTLVSNDDEGCHDSCLIFQPSRTGEYLLRVTDQRGAGGEDFIYRIEATEPLPELTAFLPRPDRMSQERQAISVPRGNRVCVFLAVQRQGVSNDVRLTPQGLPTGIVNFPVTIPADRYLAPVVIEAAADAPISGGLVRIDATSEAAGSTVLGNFRQIVDLVNASADRLYLAETVDRLAIAVVEEAPFEISLDEPKSPLAQDGTLELIVRIKRSAAFSDAVDITFPFLPPWVDGPAKITIPADKSEGVYLAHAFPQAHPRVWQVCAEGRAAVEMARPGSIDPAADPFPRRNRRRGPKNDCAVATRLVDLVIAESPVTGTIGRIAGEQGRSLKINCTINRLGRVPDSLEATLEGLPNRVVSSPVVIAKQDSVVHFAVSLEETAPVGEFENLICRLSGTLDGQGVTYCVGRDGILKIEPRGGLVTDADGRPLSKLEALRRKKGE